MFVTDAQFMGILSMLDTLLRAGYMTLTTSLLVVIAYFASAILGVVLDNLVRKFIYREKQRQAGG